LGNVPTRLTWHWAILIGVIGLLAVGEELVPWSFVNHIRWGWLIIGVTVATFLYANRQGVADIRSFEPLSATSFIGTFKGWYETVKLALRLLLYVAAVAIVYSSSGHWASHLKVTNPAEPGFNVNQFRIEDYSGHQLTLALQALLPAGTPRDNAEHLLIDIAGAQFDGVLTLAGTYTTQSRFTPDGVKREYYRYRYTTWYSPITSVFALYSCRGWTIEIHYDDRNNVNTVRGSGPCI
jgi:hypothetical protein